MDVNEQIVKEWLCLCKKQFAIENVLFKVPRNYSDIDILAMDKKGDIFDYEIKWRSAWKMDQEFIDKICSDFDRPERIKKIEDIIGKSKRNKILITTKFTLGQTLKKKQETENFSKNKSFFEKNKIEVIFFEDILKELIGEIDKNGRYNTPISQTIRMLKYFEFLNGEKSNNG